MTELQKGRIHSKAVLCFCNRSAEERSTDSLAEWSKALAPGASPKGRGFEPRSCHFQIPGGLESQSPLLAKLIET